MAARPGNRWLFALLAASVAGARAQEGTPEQIAWIRNNAIVFKTVEAGHGLEDLQPLRQLIGDARIVSLGEPTHGSREVFQLKHRLLEFLVEEMGFSVFSIEANMPEAFRLNDYVLRGEGDPRALIRGLYFWTWTTEEVREMVEWMRRHNAEPELRRKGPQVTFTGFDVQTPDVAAKIVAGFVENADPAYFPVVREAARTALAAGRRSRPTSGATIGTFPADLARGKTVLYRGWIKTEGLQDGYAGLAWRCDVGTEERAVETMKNRGPRGTTPWRHFEISIAVPTETTSIKFGTLMTGRGQAWFDALEVLVDGQPVALPAFDLDFEAARLRGFTASGQGYKVSLDRAAAKTGRQSLRIESAEMAPAGGGDPVKAAEAWQAVVDHLQQRREDYGKGRDALSLEWAINNARLVKDSMDIRADAAMSEPVRDRAMARMVAWILEQSPNARIVLWAHNAHVQRQPRSMGRFLEDLFPGQMAVLGFATGKGTYRASPRSGKGQSQFGLTPPPPLSFERAFQATGLPRFILDLRKAIPNSPGSGWLLDERLFRGIGSMEMKEQFHALKIREAFDAVVWIEKTSASFPLGR